MSAVTNRAFLALVSVGAFAWTQTFYVSPGGRDTWSGRLPSMDAAGTDGPFATLTRARDAVREWMDESNADGQHATVLLRGGRYESTKPFVLTPRDSGRPRCHVIYAAYPGEKPVISGGRRVTNWRKHTDGLWVADVPWVRGLTEPFTQLFVDGQRCPRARTPNQGEYLYSKRLTMPNGKVCTGLTFVDGDLQPWPGFVEDARIVLFHNWVNSYNSIGTVDWDRRRIRFSRPAGVFFLGPSVRYYVENVRAALDSPGEWFVDQAAGLLYYYPLDGTSPNRSEVIAPVVQQTLVKIQGDPALGLYVENIQFSGLSFQHTDVDLSPTYPHSVQGAHYQRGAIFAAGLRASVIADCEFTRLGEHAVSLREACADNIVTRCHVFDVGGGGIYLSESHPTQPDEHLFTLRNTIDNNFIHDGGYIFRAGCGVFLGGSASYNRVTHNEICDLSWMGVHLGWSWTGRREAYTHHNEVAHNHIHHLGNGVLNDVGGIYTLGVSPGTVLHHNLIHDITRFERGKEGYGGWGIYLDAGSSEIRVENNVVYNTRDGGLHLHNHGHPYGDLVMNNIFAFSDDGDLMRNNDHEPETNHVHLERNIVYSCNPEILSGNNWRTHSKFTSDRNCFWAVGGQQPGFKGRTFAEWQGEGRGMNSIVADPRFVDAAGHDFRLQSGSPALTLGFQPIDVSEAGLYGTSDWRGLPEGIRHRVVETAEPPPTEWPLKHDFEEYDVSERPDGAVEDEGGARITVTDRQAAFGKQGIRFEDASEVTLWKPHWFVSFDSLTNDRLRITCRVRNSSDQPATFDVECRDWPKGEELKTGPHVRFFPDGSVRVPLAGGGWRRVATFPLGTWVKVGFGFEQGEKGTGVYELSLAPSEGNSVVKEALPFRSETFKRCTWFGLAGMDEEPAVFFADEIVIE